jgi:hypothetical protein
MTDLGAGAQDGASVCQHHVQGVGGDIVDVVPGSGLTARPIWPTPFLLEAWPGRGLSVVAEEAIVQSAKIAERQYGSHPLVIAY